MDDLWDPPNHQATEDINCGNAGCPCAYCLANDVVEETTLNEISCIEVLKILISKEDTDITELEEELMELLTQLACTNEEFSDMFSKCLREKIDFLDLSIKTLKEGTLPTIKKPAESMHDILKSLFCHYIQKKDEQFADITSNVASSSCQLKKIKQIEGCPNVASSSCQLKKIKQIEGCPNANQIQKTKVKIEEKDANYPIRVKIEDEYGPHTNPTSTKEMFPVDKSNSLSLALVVVPNTQIQQPNISLSLRLSSKKTYKKQERLNSLLHSSSSSSPCFLIEEAKSAEYYTLDELRSIAKHQQLRGYSKLRKLELAQALGIKVIEGKRKQIKRN